MIKLIIKPQFRFSTQSKYQNNLDFLYDQHSIKTKQPFFELRSGQIEILQDPIDFYIHLHKGIKSAGKRICLSSLYLGTGNLEKFLVAQIDNKIKRSTQLQLQLLFDYGRGTRMNRKNESTQTMVQHLKTTNLINNNIKIGFFRNPDVNPVINLDTDSGLREIFGVHHIKCYLFDDDILISGANLNETYFTERQDRYYYIRNAPQMANYMYEFIGVLLNNSYQIGENGDLITFNNQPGADKKKEFKKRENFEDFYDVHDIHSKKKAAETQQDYEFQEQKQQNENQYSSSNINNKQNEENQQQNEEFIDLEEDQDDIQEQQKNKKQTISEKLDQIVPKYFKEDKELQIELEEKKDQAKQVLEQSYNEVEVGNIVRRIDQALYKDDKNKKGDLIDMGGKVYVFPTIQIPYLDFRQDEEFITEFLKENVQKPDSKLYIATGYLSFTQKIQNIILQAKNKEINILTAAPIANSFYKAGRVKGWIPYFYRVFEYNFLKEVQNNKKQQIFLHEFQKNQWTFHSKGMWVCENNQDVPNLTIIGSSNYSSRSYNRDTELNFTFYSMCDKFSNKLLLETQHQYTHTQEKTKLNLSKDDPDMKLSWFTRQFAKLFKSFL
ncbi:hypothetical protein PPERSA_11067 [Pseudocohnilembus persalinus]|uniref:CDP-diacylglycerol--glycerol-3-phosphate 3-phosphatidyltransferase n=1 Tax=Pseudocohnilembus persalinus TaxID=266149 RepID=A0A0V0QZ57_PSEPJ|nr:hypothetical protein PPERSA_11067 [Pseudocohnilembus persalinus]|eukprot:KRX07518.1 hypothetical protein PPERSA_11067 [Pseudocohnilembus persalinus]